MIGTTLGHYRIVRLVGKGGMGEVYAAEDQTLGRQVALKVLAPELVSKPDDVERFAREARAIAALNHPGIVTVHAFERAGDVQFLTMELVDGRPLSEQIPRHGLGPSELLTIGVQIAEAVSAAHDKGVVHRDLKPANVLVLKDGRIKVLDFGLAKLRAPDPSLNSELPTQPLTGEGRIVGTVAYMAPEQAEGKPVDERSDVFSLGVMLYELATGQRPFQGDTSLSVLTAVMRETPKSASAINPAVPPAITRVIKTCLQKSPDRRYQSVKDVRNELQVIQEEIASGEIASAPRARAGGAGRAIALLATGVLVAAAVAVAWYLYGPGSTTAPPLSIHHRQLTQAAGVEDSPAISPDGKWVAYVSNATGNPDIHLQSVGGQTAINLTKDSLLPDSEPAFSPDGERIAFRSERSGGGIFVMGRTGEAPRLVTAGGFSPAWSPDGREVVYSSIRNTDPASRTTTSALRIARMDTGESRVLLDADGLNPTWSPNGRFIAYWGLRHGAAAPVGNRDLWIIPPAGGTPWRVTDDVPMDWAPVWSSDGRWLFFSSDRGGSMNLWRLPMDQETGRPSGPPEALTTPSPYVANPKVSGNGAIVAYASRTTRRNVHRAPFDAARLVAGPVEPVTTGTRPWFSLDPSPDGQHLALSSYQPNEDIFICRVDGSDLRQITTDAAFDRFPVWSSDGSLIAFYSNRTGKYEAWTTTLAGQLKQLTDAREYTTLYPTWSPNGDRMVFSDPTQNVFVLFDPRKPWTAQTPEVLPRPPTPAPATLLFPRWSPDGTRIGGIVRGDVMIYEIATKTYTEVAKGNAMNWLPDGRVLAIQPALVIVDPKTRSTAPVKFVGPTPPWGTQTVRLARDGRMIYFITVEVESDIWIAEIARPQDK